MECQVGIIIGSALYSGCVKGLWTTIILHALIGLIGFCQVLNHICVVTDFLGRRHSNLIYGIGKNLSIIFK